MPITQTGPVTCICRLPELVLEKISSLVCTSSGTGIGGNTQDLLSLCLVAKAFFRPAQRELYREIGLTYDPTAERSDIDRLLVTLRHKPYLTKLVRRIALYCLMAANHELDDQVTPRSDHLNSQITALLTSCTNMQDFTYTPASSVLARQVP